MNETSSLDIMQELIGEGDIEALKELLEESIKPLIAYRIKKEKAIASKEINDMYKLEQEAQ